MGSPLLSALIPSRSSNLPIAALVRRLLPDRAGHARWIASSMRFRKFHAIRRGLAGLSDQLQVEFAASFDASIARQWHPKARDAQLPPTDLANFWLFMAVRGSGKSEAMPQAAPLPVNGGIPGRQIVPR